MTATEVCARLVECGIDVTLGEPCNSGTSPTCFASVGDQAYVLKWHERPDDYGLSMQSFARVERLRQSGTPLVGGRLPPIAFEGGVAFLQQRLPGNWSDGVDARFVGAIADLNAVQAGIGDGQGPWRDTFVETLLEGGRGWCRHDLVAQHSSETHRVVELCKTVGRDLPALPEGDIVHFDLHHRNVLRKGTAVTGVIDWEDARSGDRKFDLVTLYAGLAVARCSVDVLGELRAKLLDEIEPDVLLVYAVHMDLRLLDWAITTHDESSVIRVLNHCGALIQRLHSA